MRLFQREMLICNKNWDGWMPALLPFEWQSQYSSWQDIKYLYSTGFVVVGSEGKITQSDDGVIFKVPWNPNFVNNPITDNIYGIGLSNNFADNNVKYIINTSHNVYATNEDLETFNYSYLANDISFKSSEYGNGVFITVGSPGDVLLTNETISKGKVTFTNYENKLGVSDVRKIKHVQLISKFYAMGGSYNNQRVWASSNGTNWAENVIGSDERINWQDIVYFRKNNYHALILIGYFSGTTYVSYCEGSTSVMPYIFSEWSEPVYISTEFEGKCGILANDRILVCGTNGKILTSPKLTGSTDLHNLIEDRSLWNVETTPNNEDWKGIAKNNERVVIIGKNNIAYKKIRNIV